MSTRPARRLAEQPPYQSAADAFNDALAGPAHLKLAGIEAKGAWRFLRWRWTDPATNAVRLLPAEHFGPLIPEPRVADA